MLYTSRHRAPFYTRWLSGGGLIIALLGLGVVTLFFSAFLFIPSSPVTAPSASADMSRIMPQSTDSGVIPVPDSMHGSDDFTISAWVQLSRAVPRRECVMSGGDAIEFAILASGRLELLMQIGHKGETSQIKLRGRTQLVRGQWHHIAASYNHRGGGLLVVDGVGDTLPFDIHAHHIIGNPVEWPTSLRLGSCASEDHYGVFGGQIVDPRVMSVFSSPLNVRSSMFTLYNGDAMPVSDIAALQTLWLDAHIELYRLESVPKHEFTPISEHDISQGRRATRKTLAVIVPVADPAALDHPNRWSRACHKPHESGLDVDLVFWHASADTLKLVKTRRPPFHPPCFKEVLHKLAPSVPEARSITFPWHRADVECWLFYSMFESRFLVEEYQYAFVIDKSVRPVRSGWIDRVEQEVKVAASFEPFWLKGSVVPHNDPERLFTYGVPALYLLGDPDFNSVLRVVHDRYRLSTSNGGGGRAGGCHCGDDGAAGSAICIRKYLVSEEAFATSQSTLHLWRYHDLAYSAGSSISEDMYFLVG